MEKLNCYERRTHDYKRNSNVQLYATLEVQIGRVVSRIEKRHWSREFIAFMNQLLHTYPFGEPHVILDNVNGHNSKEVREWHKQPRYKRVFFISFPPTLPGLTWLKHCSICSKKKRFGEGSSAGSGDSHLGLSPEIQRRRTHLPLGKDRGGYY